MHTEAINEIKSMMGDALQPWQMDRLNSVLSQVLGGTDEFQQKDKKNIVRQFIAAKRIEGCSKRTEEYYYTTLDFFEKHIKCNICDADTDTIRDYLAGYGVDATVTDTGKKSPYDLSIFLENAANSKDNFMIIGRIPGKNGEEDHFVNINAYNKETEKVTASDTSMTPLGHEKRNLKSVNTNTFDRLIIIKIKSIED